MGGESCCSSREGERRPDVERPNLSMVFFLFVAAARASLTYLLRKIQYFYTVLAYGASTPARIYPLASRYGARLRGPKSNGVNDGRTAVLYHFSTYDELEEMRQPATTHKNQQKHRNHGGRAALLSSDVELMVWHDRTCGRPVHGVGRGRG